MEELKKILNEKNLSLVLRETNGTLHEGTGRGVSDLYDFYTRTPEVLKDAEIADKIVGGGAAALMIVGGVKRVHTRIISEKALEYFKQAPQVQVEWDEVVPVVKNRKGDGLCPTESSVAHAATPQEAIPGILNFVRTMRASIGMKA